LKGFLSGDQSVNNEETRKFIHDLANSFSIIDAAVVRALTLLQRSNPQLHDEISKLQKADEYIKKSVQTLRQMREKVHQDSQK
jgi:hypothetical protein